MGFPAALRHDLQLLLASVGDDDATVLILLDKLGEALTLTVTSYLGLQIVLVDHGHPVTATTFPAGSTHHDIAASLRLPLNLMLPADPASTIVFYAGTSGAYVDLAADLTHVLQLPPPHDQTLNSRSLSQPVPRKPRIDLTHVRSRSTTRRLPPPWLPVSLAWTNGR